MINVMGEVFQFPCIPEIKQALLVGDIHKAIDALNAGSVRGAPDRQEAETFLCGYLESDWIQSDYI